MTVQPLTPEVARELELTGRREGVVIREVDPDGAAAAAGLQPGDVIVQVNGQAVNVGDRTEVGARPGRRPAGAAARRAQGRRRIRARSAARSKKLAHGSCPGATRAGTLLHPIDGAAPGPCRSSDAAGREQRPVHQSSSRLLSRWSTAAESPRVARARSARPRRQIANRRRSSGARDRCRPRRDG